MVLALAEPTLAAPSWWPFGKKTQTNQASNALEIPTDSRVDKYFQNLTQAAIDGRLPKYVAGGELIRKLDESFSKATNKSVSIVAPRGAGKTALIEGYAQHLYETGSNKVVLLLDAKSLVAGANEAGATDLMTRLKHIVSFLEKNKNVILFIDEVHTLFQNNKEAVEVLKEPLSRGRITLGTATTDVEYREFVEKDGAWVDRFNRIDIPEMTFDRLVMILESLKGDMEKEHGIRIMTSSIEEVARQTLANFPSDSPARKAIDIMDRVMVREKLETEKGSMDQARLKDQIEILERRIQNLNSDLEFIPNDEDTLKRKAQVEAELGVLKESLSDIEVREDARYSRSQIPLIEKEMKTLDQNSPKYKELADALTFHRHKVSLGHVNEAPSGAINKINVLKFVQGELGIPLEILNERPVDHFARMEADLKSQLVGQNRPVQNIIKAIKRSESGVEAKSGPKFILLLVGGPGLGKDTSADIITRVREGDGKKPITINFNQLDAQTAKRAFFGIEPGYKDSEMGGKFDAVRRRAKATIHLNEVDKGSPTIWQSLLQILDQGKTEDGRGRILDFRNTGMIMSANWGREYSLERNVLTRAEIEQKYGLESGSLNGVSENQMDRMVIEKIMRDAGVSEEFINRVKPGIVVMNDLSFEDTKEVARRLIERRERYIRNEFRVNLTIDPMVAEMVARIGYNPGGGARMINGSVSETVTDLLAEVKTEHPESFSEGRSLEMKFTYDTSKTGGVLSVTQNGQTLASQTIQLGADPREAPAMKTKNLDSKASKVGEVGQNRDITDPKEIIKKSVGKAKRR